MAIRGLIKLSLVLAVVCASGHAFAHDGHDHPHPGAAIKIMTPTDGEIFDRLTITLRVETEENEAGALDEFDHIHWGIGAVADGGAVPDSLQVPDGAFQDVYILEDEAQNGEYEICAYLAREDHSLLSEIECITILVATSGADLILPKGDEVYNTCDVPLNYNFFANTSVPERQAAAVRYSINGGESIVRTESSLATTVALPDGEHHLSFQAEQTDGTPLGRVLERSFTVESPMTPEKFCEAFRFARRGSKKRSKRMLRKSAGVLVAMAGSCNKHPEIKSITNRRVNRSIKKLRQAIRGSRQLNRKVLRGLRRPCRGK